MKEIVFCLVLLGGAFTAEVPDEYNKAVGITQEKLHIDGMCTIELAAYRRKAFQCHQSNINKIMKLIKSEDYYEQN